MNPSCGMGRSSGSSSNGARGQRRNGGLWCKCGRPSVVYTSKTQRNPNRAFFGCQNFKEKKPFCGFFRWVDDATTETMELEDWRIHKLESNVAEMDFKLSFVDMKVHEQIEVQMNGMDMKIKEHQIKINELEQKMVGDIGKVDKEIINVNGLLRVLGINIVILIMICIYVGARLE